MLLRPLSEVAVTCDDPLTIGEGFGHGWKAGIGWVFDTAKVCGP